TCALPISVPDSVARARARSRVARSPTSTARTFRTRRAALRETSGPMPAGHPVEMTTVGVSPRVLLLEPGRASSGSCLVGDLFVLFVLVRIGNAQLVPRASEGFQRE